MYYANAIETGASAIEMSAIAARNAALGVLADLGLPTRAQSDVPEHEEL